jgi:hypothetical protein
MLDMSDLKGETPGPTESVFYEPSSPMGKTRLYSVEYIDDEGDSVINHAYMTPQQALDLLERMRVQGVGATICDLSGSSGTDVMSVDEGQMGKAGRRLIE